ncbi:MAG: NADH-quinone oxidoreductase subunit L [Planctomycetota bacterium]|nr:NADH-quinone oxidoreductase subunit L [Planctomycetota bacterium]
MTLTPTMPLFTLASDAASGMPASGSCYTLLVPLLTILSAVLCTLCAIFKVKSKLPAWITVACLAASFGAILYSYLNFEGGVRIAHGFDWINFTLPSLTGTAEPMHFVANFSFYVDSLTLLWMLFVTGLATLIALYASEYMSHDVGAGYCRFFFAFSLFVFSMSCLVMGDNLVLLYLGWEGVGLCSYLLIGYFYKKPSAVAAAKKAFIVNRIGDLGLAMGLMLTWVHFGSVEYAVVFAKAQPYIEALKAGQLAQIPAIVQWIPVLLMIGAFGKSAQLPLYVWLPDAMEGPTPVSALIHAATMVTAGVYLIARTYPLFLTSVHALPIVAWVGALTALLAATIGMAQFDIKRIMAYSTVSQLGYMFAGLGVLTSTGAAFHVLTHAFFKALLFLCCGAVMHGFAGQLDLRKLSGVAYMKGWGIVGMGMFVGCLNLAGFPFTAGFFSKDMILAEAFVTPGMAPIGWILLLTAGLTAYYTFRVFFRVFVGPKAYEPGDEVHAHDDHGHDHGHGDHAHDHGHAHDKAHAAHDFHPHAPGWAINTVLVILTIGSLAAASLYFVHPSNGAHGGWAAGMVQSSSAAYTTPYGHHEAAATEGHAEAHAAAEGHASAHAAYPPATQLAANEFEGSPIKGGSFFGQDPHAVMYYVSGGVGAVGILIAFFLHFVGRTTAATSKADALLPLLGGVARAAQHKWYVDEIYDYLIRKPLLVASHIFHWIDKLLVDGLVNLAGATPRTAGSAVRPSQSGLLHGYAVGMAGGIAVVLVIVLLVAGK